VKVYNKYHPEVSRYTRSHLDRNRESWQKGMENDPPGWINVSDLAYWDSPVVELYRIESLPVNFLIDPNGVIIASNMTDSELEQKLNEILQ